MGFGRGFGGGNRGGGRGGGFGGGRGSRGGGRGGGRGYDQGPPESVQPFGVFTHPCENQIVVKATIEEVPYFNALIYLENMEIIGKVDEIFGSIRDYSVSVVLESTFKPTSFTPNQTLFIDPNKLLPLQKFLPKPPGEKPQRGEGGRPGRGGGGRGGGRGFRGGGGRGGRGGFSGGGNHGGGSRSGNFGRGGGFRGGGGRGGRGGGFRGRSY